jgi:hypothetical protein
MKLTDLEGARKNPHVSIRQENIAIPSHNLYEDVL